MRPPGFALRVAAAIAVAQILLIGGAVWQGLWRTDKAMAELIEAKSSVLIQTTEGFVRASLLKEEYSELQEYLSNLTLDPEIVIARASNWTGRVVASSDPRELGMQANGGSAGDRIVVSKTVANAAAPLGSFVIELNPAVTQRAFEGVRKGILSTAAFAMILSIAIAYVMGKMLTRRLAVLERATAQIGRGEFDVEIRFGGKDEIGRLGEMFGQMATALRANLEQRRRAEEQLRQSQKMEAIGQLAGGVAHDFNNLLTIIMTCSEELGDHLREGDEEAREDLDDVLQAARRASELTSRLLAFARRMPSSPVPIDLNVVLRDAERMLRRVLPANIALKLEQAPDLWPVLADRSQVDQILLNLAVNARDAMPEGGTLSISTVNQDATGAAAGRFPGMTDGDYVRLSVRDSGTGMTPEVLEHAFEPFFTTKAPGSGTGLGLATVYGIVRQNRGFLRVESAPGEGALFEICFPRADGEAGGTGVEKRTDILGDETILLVEDDPALRRTTARTLGSCGWRVLAAESAKHAIDLFGTHSGQIHLLVTDVVMPGMSGKELAATLRAQSPALPVLFMSGYAENALLVGGVVEEGVNFIPKPFTTRSLAGKVRKVLDGATPLADRSPG